MSEKERAELLFLAEKLRMVQHACQCATGHDIAAHEGDPVHSSNRKHLRVGVNNALVESGAMWGLLVDKGIITHKEMYEKIIEAYKAELVRWEQQYPGITFEVRSSSF